MIQRKQSIWLLLASMFIGLMFFLPFGLQSEAGNDMPVGAKNDMILMIGTIIAALSAFFVIFLYKNRKLQMKITFIPILLCLLLLAYELYLCYASNTGYKMVIGLLGSNLFIGVFLPLVAIVFLGMAYNGIKSDDKLVREMDRLR